MFENLFSMQGLSLDRLKNFLAFADSGSIVAAAGNDHVRQSLYSRQIRELGEFFGVELVKRQGKGLALTEAGRRLAGIAREQFGSLADFAREAKGLPATVSIVTANSLATWLLMPRLMEIRRRLPHHRLILQHDQTRPMIQGVLEGKYDIGLVREKTLLRTLGRKSLGRVGFALFIPKKLADRMVKDDPTGWLRLPLALPVGGTLRGEVDRLAEKNGIELNVVVACESYVQAAVAMESGAVASILPSIAARTLARPGIEVRAMPELVLGNLETLMIWSKRVAATRKSVRDAVEGLGEILSSESHLTPKSSWMGYSR